MKSSNLEPFGERGKVIMHQALVDCRFPAHFYVPSHNLTLIKFKHCCIASISILLGEFFLLILCYQFTWKRSQTLFLRITCLIFFFYNNMSKFCFDTPRNSKLGEKVTGFSFIVFLPKQSVGLLFICWLKSNVTPWNSLFRQTELFLTRIHL